MSSPFKIEKGIPQPVAHGSKWSVLRTMEVGDSFHAPREEGRRLTAVACNRRIFPDKRFTVRAVDGGFRCWRTA